MNEPEVEVVCGARIAPEALRDQGCRRAYSPEIVEFLAAFSREVLRNPESRIHPDLAAAAFFLRPANLERWKPKPDSVAIGRGLAFHVAPSNVPLMFLYSLAAGLLAGNANIVRAPSRRFPQADEAFAILDRLASRPEHAEAGRCFSIVRYPRDSATNRRFSSLCDVRIIWGGDETIREIREAPLPPRAFDVCFADRYSICVIDASSVDESSVEDAARGFYADAYTFDQMACSSPRLVHWIGTAEAVERAKGLFWQTVEGLVAKAYRPAPISSTDKLEAACEAALEGRAGAIDGLGPMAAVRIRNESFSSGELRRSCGGGFFRETVSDGLDGILPVCGDGLQTVSCFGIDPAAVREWCVRKRLRGIDRICHTGRATEFSLVWDGFDLSQALSRTIEA